MFKSLMEDISKIKDNYTRTWSTTDSRSAQRAFQNSISVRGPGFSPLSKGCAEFFESISLTWWHQSITTDSTACTTCLSNRRSLHMSTCIEERNVLDCSCMYI